MTNEREKKDRILSKSKDMFYQYGYSKVTMEEIATNLGISKKTLYKHFSNKEHILKDIIHKTKCEVESYVEKLIADKKTEFIIKLHKFMSFIVSHFTKLTHPLVQDLVKNQPEIWKDIQTFRQKNAYDCFSKLIEQGKENGIFKKEINSEVVVLVYFSAVYELLSLETLSKLPITANEAYSNIVKILFDGIFSKEGRKKYITSKLLSEFNGEPIL